jgi:hypothetical protein
VSATLILVVLALGQTQPEKAVTAAEKAEFFAVLAKLPTRGESFTAEAVTKAVPYTRILLALTEKDLEGRDLYPLLALSSGLMDRKEPRQYGTANFRTIGHPTVRLFWAAGLFRQGSASPEVVAFLRKALDSKADAGTLAEFAGPGFEEFKDQVVRAYDAARPTTVSLVKRHTIDAFPAFSPVFDYTRESYTFGPDRHVYAVRPLDQRGELNVYDSATGATARRVVPQPDGFKAEVAVLSYFDNPVLSVNARGDLFCRWTIRGNGDHGLGLLKKGTDSFRAKRVELNLADCEVVADPDGTWYLIQGAPHFTVYRVDQDLALTRLGSFAGKGHHTIRIADARFLGADVLHLFWGDVLTAGNHLRMRCIDFDVTRRAWRHDREIYRLDRFVSSANEPTVVQLADGSLHYLWRVDEGQKRGTATGVYYQAEADGKTVKVADGYQFQAVAVGDRIVVGYTAPDAPEKVFFRVIRHGTPGPVSEITAAPGREHALWSQDMVLHADGGRLWFVNTVARNMLYELKLVDANAR